MLTSLIVLFFTINLIFWCIILRFVSINFLNLFFFVQPIVSFYNILSTNLISIITYRNSALSSMRTCKPFTTCTKLLLQFLQYLHRMHSCTKLLLQFVQYLHHMHSCTELLLQFTMHYQYFIRKKINDYLHHATISSHYTCNYRK